ncbi:cyclic nucleotide-binding domain-containing protein [Azospirillum sp. A39]|uniref:cyclic nucleotide-binding domain-containing protein n=1 Tax=Azospirillum sp. A39 TaxID=3462279 RepID=UPI004045E8B2
MHFREGDVLFREGDASDFACRVVEGKVVVVKESGGTPMILGEAGPGDIVGEMGVVERKPRSATVRAAGDVTVEVLAAERLIDAIGGDPDTARRMLLRLSDRVRSLSEEVVRLRAGTAEAEDPAATPAEAAPPPDLMPPESTPPVLTPAVAAPQVAERYAQSARLGLGVRAVALRCIWLPDAPSLWVNALPFRVGRAPQPVPRPVHKAGALLVPDTPPYRLSLNHFAIIRDDRLGLVVRDLGSELGTTVNGQYLGGIFAKDSQRLQSGDNLVVAGGLHSPFTFHVQVAE